MSYLYEKNKSFFKTPDADLESHLSKYLLKSHKEDLLAAKEITADITDWSFADLYGSTRSYGGSVSNNSAALIDAFVALPGAGVSFTNSGAFNGQISNISPLQRLSPKHRSHLMEILRVREIKKGSVTVQDLEDTEEQGK
ncbi:hypothetical protein [Colwellia psychrerythraea]|uniref:Uncharacterized protein n=1 Tax=Colwellia psychrerythraea TaxID=28229 RepID=A0A099KDV0_COLPS|nr:hypothetical protein [Colwellia psychrerythraea]KGJ87758.1 hypothetical protein GAB14E_4436 [Colwellia psychrerythraea]